MCVVYQVVLSVCVCVWSVRWTSSEVFSRCWWPAGGAASVIVNTSSHSVISCAVVSTARYVLCLRSPSADDKRMSRGSVFGGLHWTGHKPPIILPQHQKSTGS